MVSQTSVSQTDREDSPSPRFLIPLVVNDTYACDNDRVLNGLLKTELGFEGCVPPLSQFLCLMLIARADVMSDWWASHSTESAMRGLDVRLRLRCKVAPHIQPFR